MKEYDEVGCFSILIAILIFLCLISGGSATYRSVKKDIENEKLMDSLKKEKLRLEIKILNDSIRIQNNKPSNK